MKTKLIVIIIAVAVLSAAALSLRHYTSVARVLTSREDIAKPVTQPGPPLERVRSEYKEMLALMKHLKAKLFAQKTEREFTPSERESAWDACKTKLGTDPMSDPEIRALRAELGDALTFGAWDDCIKSGVDPLADAEIRALKNELREVRIQTRLEEIRRDLRALLKRHKAESAVAAH